MKFIMKKLSLSLLIFLMFFTVSWAQQSEVKGTVLDAITKEPIIGATVVEQGTTNGSMTDMDGVFKLKTALNATIDILYMGYNSESVVLNGKTSMVIELTESILSLDEVVVVGYGGQKRSSLSTSISSLKLGDDIKGRPTSLMSSLQGQIAGLTISSNGGDPLSGTNIVIRGQGSRQGDPVLFVVDGVPGAPYNEQDVESVTVLKDAAAAAIYGANVGSGGVILITTKKAKEGGFTVNVKLQGGLQQAYKLPDMLTAKEYNRVRRDAANISNSSIPIACNSEYYPYGDVTRTDWLDEVFRVGSMQNYAISISGGNEKATGLISIEYNEVEGTLHNTHSNRLGINTSVNFTPYKWLTISERISYKYTNGQGGVNNSSHTGVIASAMFYPRSSTVYEMDKSGNYMLDANGNRFYGGTVPLWAQGLGVAGSYGEIQNPVATLNRLEQYRPTNNLYSTTSVTIKPIADFSIKSDFTAKGYFNRYEDFVSKSPEIGKPNLRNSRTISNTLGYGYIWETVATYEKYIKKHHISVMGGLSVIYDKEHSNRTVVSEFPNEGENSQNFVNGGNWSDTKPTESFGEQATIGLFTRASYSYDDRYFMVASVRRDASSKLYNKNNSGVFPSLSAAWKLSSENFMLNQNVVDLFKIRASWGRIGNVSAVNNYSYASSLVSTGEYVYLGNTHQNPIKGMGLETIPNLDLTWETSEQANIGVDLKLLSNRLTITSDLYVKTTRDLIEKMPVPSVAGLMKAPYANIGIVENSGWEFTASYYDSFKSGFSYEISANASLQKNKVKDLGDRDFMAHTNTIRAMQPLRSTVNESWYSYYLIKTDGIFQTQEEVDSYVYINENGKSKKIQPNAQAGDLKFVDYNNDGIISDDDRQFMDSYLPKVVYGVSANFTYKGFDLSLQIQGVAGNKIFNGVKVMTYAPGQGWNMSSDVLDSWGYNKNSDIPLLSMSDKNGNTSTESDFFLEDGSYARLKNLTIGYTLPQKWFRSNKDMNARVYFSGENLFTLTKYSGMDPEVGNYGLDGGSYPVSRIFSFGLNFSF